MNIGEGISGAVFDGPDCRHRLALWRIWDKDKPKLLFCGLNPSTAYQYKDDPTVLRMVDFAKRWGYGGLFVGNLFSLVTPYPEDLWLQPSWEEANGPNDEALKQMRLLCDRVMVGWGNEGQYAGKRPETVIALVGYPVYCLKVTKAGEPSHPLYFKNTSQLIPYGRASKEG